MDMKKCGEACQGYSLFILRVIVGAIFIYHGFPKITGMPELLGLPGSIGLLVGLVEVIFGFLLLIGFGFPWTIYPLMGVIIVAWLFVQIPRGITTGSERDLLIFLCLFVLHSFGMGKYALRFKKKK